MPKVESTSRDNVAIQILFSAFHGGKEWTMAMESDVLLRMKNVEVKVEVKGV